MRRNLLALALTAGLLLALTACGKTERGSNLAAVQARGYLNVGVTRFAPMDYQDETGAWVGFDADLAHAFAQRLGVNVMFTEIDWGKKAQLLADGDIDVVWNGMTLTDSVRTQMTVSAPYCRNVQVVVTPVGQAEFYREEDSLKDLDILADGNSTGAAALDHIGVVYTPVDSQLRALTEVAEGRAGACVMDHFMAAASVGPNTDYPQLTVAQELGDTLAEKIVVGFRLGSDLADPFAQFWADAWADGTVAAAAQTYGMTSYLIAP